MGETANRPLEQAVLLEGGPFDGRTHTIRCAPSILAITGPLLVFDQATHQLVANRDELESGKAYFVYRLDITDAEVCFRFTDMETRDDINRFETSVVNRAAAPILYLFSLLPMPIYVCYLSGQPAPISGWGASPLLAYYFGGWVVTAGLGSGLAWYAHRWSPAAGTAIALTVFNVALAPLMVMCGLLFR